MAYNHQTADKVLELLLSKTEDVTEKEMFSGICFMVAGKMCICVAAEELLCRIGADQVMLELERGHTRNMMNNGRVMKDYIYVEDTGFDTPAKLKDWVDLCLAFNPLAKAAPKKRNKPEISNRKL